MLFRNPTDQKVRLYGVTWEPGDVHDVPDEWIRRPVKDNGSRGQSIVEKQAPQLVPADPDAFATEAPPPPPKPRPVVIPPRVPPGVAEAIRAAADASDGEDEDRPPPVPQGKPRKPKGGALGGS